MFTLIGGFFGWVSFHVYLFVADMRYDAAIHDKKKLIRQLTDACAERFKSLYALDGQILQIQLRIEENMKIANGAATAYLDDSEQGSFHRLAGEQAVAKIHGWETKIREWEAAKTDNRKALVELKKASMQAEEDLCFLEHDKPRALADLRAARQELEIGQRDVHWPETIDKRNREQIGGSIVPTSRQSQRVDRDDYRDRGRAHGRGKTSTETLFPEMLAEDESVTQRGARIGWSHGIITIGNSKTAWRLGGNDQQMASRWYQEVS